MTTRLRPLSPNGEGYCSWCCFVVGLTSAGRLEGHNRDLSQCEGSFKAPAARTPYYSRKSAFRVNVKRVWCPLCCTKAPVRRADGKEWYARHGEWSRPPCPRSGSPID